MIEYEIILNKTYKHSCNLITEKIKGNYIYIEPAMKTILIDNIQIKYKWEEVHEIRFMVKGYRQIIYINEYGNVVSTDIEFPIK